MTANTLLYVEERTVGNELAGEPAETWTRQENARWFKVRSLGGSEFFQAQQMTAVATHALECVYFSGTNPRMRLTAGEADSPTRIFNVRSVVDRNDQHKVLDWLVEEVR